MDPLIALFNHVESIFRLLSLFKIVEKQNARNSATFNFLCGSQPLLLLSLFQLLTNCFVFLNRRF